MIAMETSSLITRNLTTSKRAMSSIQGSRALVRKLLKAAGEVRRWKASMMIFSSKTGSRAVSQLIQALFRLMKGITKAHILFKAFVPTQ